MSSFRKINYKLRPAKAIERKMIVDIIRKLSTFYQLSAYQYVGFGSIYFVDFSMMHKLLGISDMISIEQDSSSEKRVTFNKPFSCIKVLFNSSTIELPKIKFNKPSIIWLDYDGKLTSDVLNDINTVCAKAQTGTLFMVTVNAHAEARPEPNPDGTIPNIGEYRYAELEKQVGGSKIPIGIEGRDLNLKNLSKVLRQIIVNQINTALKNRNGGVTDDQKLYFEQIVNFRYDDGAVMLTVGGLLLDQNHVALMSTMNLDELPFYISGDDSYTIDVPNMTNKEISELDSQLHEIVDLEKFVMKSKKGFKDIVPESDIIKYAKLYRYYPTFAEAIW